MTIARRILLVEDDAHIADLLSLHLRDEGWRSCIAPAATTGWRIWSAAAGMRWYWI
jgi:DNA-binding response OmpR family regulator